MNKIFDEELADKFYGKEIVIIPEGIEKIEYDCANFLRYKYLILPTTIKIVEAQAFYSSNHEAVYIPKGIETVEPLAFSGVMEMWLEGEVTSGFMNECGTSKVENYEFDFHRGGVTTSDVDYKNTWVNEDAVIKTNKTLEEFKKYFNIK